jgi:hypothetical protein
MALQQQQRVVVEGRGRPHSSHHSGMPAAVMVYTVLAAGWMGCTWGGAAATAAPPQQQQQQRQQVTPYFHAAAVAGVA